MPRTRSVNVGYVGGSRGRAAAMVRPLEAAGVRHSTRFGPDELARFFPPSAWEHLATEAAVMHAADPESDRTTLEVPAYYAAIRKYGPAGPSALASERQN